ncbi:uncharacterized protein EDB91DRAFT_542114 [Suillus paluster]|uniref:uncharacterized protein n=1 Tax=Suillus paluster TaxID=48578 RepID=UPI001B88126D|nr:uncharacterized protein EDB91DRAFT_542114 [Suillus paluster]KAG1735870.1 hypothetical protein EDB91DRAFT_542114 [Suillus paluster]
MHAHVSFTRPCMLWALLLVTQIRPSRLHQNLSMECTCHQNSGLSGSFKKNERLAAGSQLNSRAYDQEIPLMATSFCGVFHRTVAVMSNRDLRPLAELAR